MITAPAVLQPGAQLGTSAAAIVTGAASTQTLIRRAVFTNTDTVAHAITVYRVPSGGTAGAGNMIISAQRLAPGQAYVAPELSSVVLNAGDTIQALADVAAKVNAFAHGFQVT